MKISIITVVFNGEKTIARAIESVISQGDVQIEYIVIDGESTDRTLEMILPYRQFITHFVSEKDAGIYDAMNKGLGMATGEVIGILNADDFYANPYVLSRIMGQFNGSSVDAVFGDLAYFRAANPEKIVRTYRSKGLDKKSLSRGIMPAHPTLFLRNSIYKKFGFFDPSFRIAGDFEFITRIFRDGKINFRYLPETMVKMQLGGASTSGLISNLILLRENLRACRKNGIKTNYLMLISRYPGKLLEYLR